MPDESDPPRKVYGFKERDFKRENAPAAPAERAPTVEELAKLAGPPVFKVGREQPGSPSRGRADDPNDVFTVLQENRAVAQQGGADAIEIRKIRSRRRRDYFLLLIGGNLAIIGGVALAKFNIISVLFGGAGVILFSISVTWIMWQVMNKY